MRAFVYVENGSPHYKSHNLMNGRLIFTGLFNRTHNCNKAFCM